MKKTQNPNCSRQLILPESIYYSIDPREGYPVDVYSVELPIALEHPTGSHIIADADGALLLISLEGWSDNVRFPDGVFRDAAVSEICGHFCIRAEGRLGYESHFDWNSPPMPYDFREWVQRWWNGLSQAQQSHLAMRMRHPGFPPNDLVKQFAAKETGTPGSEQPTQQSTYSPAVR